MVNVDLGLVASFSSMAGFNQSGVYLLYRNSVPVYVGQAVNVRQRVAQHLGEGVKLFDTVSFIPCTTAALSDLERLFIERLRPEYNRTLNPAVSLAGSPARADRVAGPICRRYLSHVEAAEYLGIDADGLTRLRNAGTLTARRAPRSKRTIFCILDLHDCFAAMARDCATA